MKGKTIRLIGLGTALFFILGCSLFSVPPMEPAPITPVTASTALPEIIEPTAQPTTPPSLILPNGIVTLQDDILTVYDVGGSQLFQLHPPYRSNPQVHIAGTLSPSSTTIPLIYYSFEQNKSMLYYNNTQATPLKEVANYTNLVGVQSQPVVAYSTLEFSDSGLISNLYIGTPQTLPSSESVLYDLDPDGWGLAPLAIDMNGTTPKGIWYTQQPWGIGGDIVFQPYRTLSYLDLTSGSAYQYLGADVNPSALSADRVWLAYTSNTSMETGGGAMALRNLVSGENTSFPLVDAVDQRGAGDARFSPNIQYIAWTEANGWQMSETPNFHTLVRVGNLNGDVIAQFADTAFLNVSGMNSVRRVEPVGWLDDNTLLVMARSDDWNNAVIISIDIPTQNMRLLTHGVFIGFTYP